MIYSGAPRDTVGYWLRGTALSAHINKAGATLYEAAKAIDKSGEFGICKQPDQQAVEFYLLNQAAARLMDKYDLLEPASDKDLELLKMYSREASLIARRLFWYVLIICTREARHNLDAVNKKISQVTAEVAKEYPSITQSLVTQMFSYTKSFPDTDQALTKLLHPLAKNFPLGPFTKMLSALYYKCSWSSSFGGPKWGQIADALHSFVSGEWTAEMFADTAFTLAHNTAPIFNKGMLYAGPTGLFIELLDCQRAGMIPQWLTQDKSGAAFCGLPAVQLVKDVMPELFEAPLDWNKVEQLGAVQSYKNKPTYSKTPKKISGYKVIGQVAIDAMTVLPVLDYQRKMAA